MSYSQRQQRIISLIAERGNLSTVEFLLSLAVETREVDGQQWQDVVSSSPQRFQMFIPQWNQRNVWLLFGIESDTHLAIVDYISVVRDLLAKKLITVLPDPKRHVRASAIISSVQNTSLNDRDRAALEIDALLQTSSEILGLGLYTERVYALPSLARFITQNYRSAEEVSVDLRLTNDQQNYRWLKRLCLSAIALSLLVFVALLLSLYWQYRFMNTMTAMQRSEERPKTNWQLNVPPDSLKSPRDTIIVHDTIPAPKEQRRPRKKKKRKYDTSEY